MTMHRTKMLVAGVLLGGLAWMPIESAGQEVDYQPLSIGVDTGTLGLGVGVGWRFSDHFGIRGGVNYMKLENDAEDTGDVEIEGDFDAEIRLLGAPVGIDFYPWREKSVRLTAGVLLNRNHFKVDSNPTQPGTEIELNGNTYDVFNDLGGASLEVDHLEAAPYLSIGGNFYFDRAKHWSLFVEVGVAYIGSAEAEIQTGFIVPSGSQLETDIAGEEARLEDKMEDYQLYPIVKVGVNFSF
jgi:uncharacterized protein YciU (UPF0263 family)